MRKGYLLFLKISIWVALLSDEMGPTGKGHKSQSAKDFVNFYNEVKQKKVDITNKEILKFSKLFEVKYETRTYLDLPRCLDWLIVSC